MYLNWQQQQQQPNFNQELAMNMINAIQGKQGQIAP